MHNFHFFSLFFAPLSCSLFSISSSMLYVVVFNALSFFPFAWNCDAKEMKTDANILQDFVDERSKKKKKKRHEKKWSSFSAEIHEHVFQSNRCEPSHQRKTIAAIILIHARMVQTKDGKIILVIWWRWKRSLSHIC